jgi:hypothetical protein
MTDQRQFEQEDAALTRDEILSLFKGFLRYSFLLKEALQLDFNSSHFKHTEQVFLVLFSAARDLYNEFRSVTKEMLLTKIGSWIETEAVTLSPQEIVFLFGADEGQGFIDEAFDTPMPDAAGQRAERQFLEGVLKRFMNVRYIKPQLQSILNRSTEDTVPTQIKSLLERFGRAAQRVDHIGTPTLNSAAMPTFGAPIVLPPPAVTTGLPWIDQYIGGVRPGDVIGVLGPYAGGKTTILATFAVRMAELYANLGENKLAVFVGYEDGAERMNQLFWSAAARIDRNLFVSAGERFWSELSDRNQLKDYDRNLPENRNGEIMFGERERWEAAMGWFNRHFVFLDFSYNESTGGRGAGGVAEIKAALERLAEERGMEIGFVCVDYAGILVERELSTSGNARAMTDQSAITRPIKKVPDELRTTIAVPLRCTVVLAHQLAPGECKKIKPFQYISHLDASGSKSFAENVHSCMCMNMRDISTLVSTIYWSKIRLGLPPCGTPHGLIRMDDHLVDVHLVNDEYIADAASRAILRRNDVRVASPPPEGREDNNRRRRGWETDSFADGL